MLKIDFKGFSDVTFIFGFVNGYNNSYKNLHSSMTPFHDCTLDGVTTKVKFTLDPYVQILLWNIFFIISKRYAYAYKYEYIYGLNGTFKKYNIVSYVSPYLIWTWL